MSLEWNCEYKQQDQILNVNNQPEKTIQLEIVHPTWMPTCPTIWRKAPLRTGSCRQISRQGHTGHHWSAHRILLVWRYGVGVANLCRKASGLVSCCFSLMAFWKKCSFQFALCDQGKAKKNDWGPLTSFPYLFSMLHSFGTQWDFWYFLTPGWQLFTKMTQPRRTYLVFGIPPTSCWCSSGKNCKFLQTCLPTNTLPETNSSHLKMDGWKTSFLLEWLPGSCYVSFREATTFPYLFHTCHLRKDMEWLNYPQRPIEFCEVN